MGLINELGANPDESAFIKKISELFSEQVVKIENGKKTVEGQKALTNQLQNARSHAFPLTLEILGILCDEEQKAVTIRFSWDSQKMGKYITSAQLRIDSNGKISEVDDIYNKFAGLDL